MSCGQCGGLNQVATLDVPPLNGVGAHTDVSSFSAGMSVEVSGSYLGAIVVLGSHDDVHYVPVLSFQSGNGVQSFKQTLHFTLFYLKVRRSTSNTTGPLTVTVGGQATCDCA